MFGLVDDSEEMVEYREHQRENELRLLGTMLFQSILLAFCILLYVNWTWSHFDTSYESAIFYAFAGFSIQAAFYFIYRAVFEDSSQHRRQLKRMRNSNRRRMATLKFEQEKAQLEGVLNQQLGIFQANASHAMSDNVINQQESEQLMGNLQGIQQAMAALSGMQAQVAGLQPQGAPQQFEMPTPQSMGIDRHRIMGIPIGPKLTLNQPIPTKTQSAASSEKKSLDLNPTGTNDARVAAKAEIMEKTAENL
jgi:hypothetical protein